MNAVPCLKYVLELNYPKKIVNARDIRQSCREILFKFRTYKMSGRHPLKVKMEKCKFDYGRVIRIRVHK